MINMNEVSNKCVIVITGYVATGKSTAMGIIKKKFHNVSILSLDTITTHMTSWDNAIVEILKHFGDDILENKHIDIYSLRKKISSNKIDFDFISKIEHQLTAIGLKSLIKIQPNKYVLVELPSFSAESSKYYDYISHVVLVTTDRFTRIKRITRMTDKCNNNIGDITASKIADEKRLQVADIVLNNEKNDFESFKEQVISKFQKVFNHES